MSQKAMGILFVFLFMLSSLPAEAQDQTTEQDQATEQDQVYYSDYLDWDYQIDFFRLLVTEFLVARGDYEIATIINKGTQEEKNKTFAAYIEYQRLLREGKLDQIEPDNLTAESSQEEGHALVEEAP